MITFCSNLLFLIYSTYFQANCVSTTSTKNLIPSHPLKHSSRCKCSAIPSLPHSVLSMSMICLLWLFVYIYAFFFLQFSSRRSAHLRRGTFRLTDTHRCWLKLGDIRAEYICRIDILFRSNGLKGDWNLHPRNMLPSSDHSSTLYSRYDRQVHDGKQSRGGN